MTLSFIFLIYMPLHIELNLFFLDAHIVLFQLGLGGMDFTAF